MIEDPLNVAAKIKPLPRQHEFFIGIDSDGCVFDAMEIKHRQCFGPAFIHHFGLQSASRCAEEVWEFVNLYSRDRGCNRFFAIQKALRLIGERSEFTARGQKLKGIPALDAWLKESGPLSNPALEAKVKATNDAGLARVLAWSKDVNQRVATLGNGMPPFPMVRESLEKIRTQADVMVVSQASAETLAREWREHQLDALVNYIAGQEVGTKTEQIRRATSDQYAPEKILMIGDAPGDWQAARDNHAIFFPIVPGKEAASWQHFFETGSERFFGGTFAGKYQQALLEKFSAALPEKAPWQK